MTTEQLIKKMSKFNTEDLISGIIEYQLMNLMDESRLYKAELLAGLLIRNEIQSDKKTLKIRNFDELYYLAEKEVNKQTGKIFEESIQAFKKGASPKELEKSFQMRIKHLYHRGDGYIHQILDFAQILYGHFDEEIYEKFGFSFTHCKEIYIYIFQKYIEKTDVLMQQAEQLIKNEEKNPNVISTYNFIYRIEKGEIYKVFDKEIVDKWLDYFTVNPGKKTNNQFNSLSDFNILYSRPIINYDEYFYLLLPVNALQNLHKVFHYEFIANKTFSKDTQENYKKLRGKVLEDLTAKYLRRLFNNKQVYESLFYFKDDHNLEDEHRFEADITVQRDNTTILCECKSKLLVLDSLKGNLNSIENDVNAAILEANKQAERTYHYIENRKKIYKLNRNGNYEQVYLRNSSEYIKICVVADHFGWIPSNISDYLESDNLPLVINIFDLDLLTKEAKDYRELLKYLVMRRNHFGKFQSIDELEIFWAYKDGNIPDMLEDDTIIVFDSHTTDMDQKYYENEFDWLMNYTFKQI